MTRSNHRSRPDGRRSWWWLVLAALTFTAIGASLVSPGGRHQWALAIFRQPTRYTALALQGAWLLPSTAPTGTRIPLVFTVENHQGRALTYRYVIWQVDPLNASRTRASSARVVASGATWSVATTVRPDCSLSPCRVEVLLPGHPEKLDFLVNLTPATRANGRRKSSAHHSHARHSARTSVT